MRKKRMATSRAGLKAGIFMAGGLAAATVIGASAVPAQAADVVMFTSPSTAPISAARAATARPIMPMLKSASQIPTGVDRVITGKASATVGSSGSARAAKEVSNTVARAGSAEPQPQGFGTSNHPFSTKGAYSRFASTPVQLHPWRPTGKLTFVRGGSTFVCSASLIKPGLLVTAAHCVIDFGTPNFNTSTSFEPARHDAARPYGTIAGTNIWVPSVYRFGTDNCTVAGVVCENDVAVIRLASNVGNTTGWYSYGVNGYGYTNTLFLGKNAANITQLGYPVAFDSGLRMIRTDSLGYFAAPNNVIIGSDQTGGSSGGPWLVNFGTTPVSASSVPSENVSNVVVATTSWGFIDSTVKQQGASRFGHNTKFPRTGKTNIQTLVDAACAAFPASC